MWNYATEDNDVSELRLDTIGGTNDVLDRTRDPLGASHGVPDPTRRPAPTFLSPQGIEGRLLYAGRDLGAEGTRADRVFRQRLPSGAVDKAGAPQKPTGVAATVRGAVFAASRNDSGTTAIIDVTPER